MAIKKMTKRGITMKKVLILSLVALSATFILTSVLFAGDVFHGGDILYTEPMKAVLFSHDVHGFPCEMCHDSIFEMQSLKAQATEDFTMQGLYDGKYCGACHAEGGMAFASNTQCASCHIGVKGYNEITGEGGGGSGH